MSNGAEQTQQSAPTTAQAEEKSSDRVIDRILNKCKLDRSDFQREQSQQEIATLVQQVLGKQVLVSEELEKDISDRITAIDKLISKQLNEVMHAAEFQKLEASWRGLHYLVHQSETSTKLKIRVLNVSKGDLLKDLKKASEFDQSALFKKVYEDEYGTPGGSPISAMIGDFGFDSGVQDMDLLNRIAEVAAAAHAPFFAAAAPTMFNMDDYTELAGPRDIAKMFERPEYTVWRTFRDKDESRYVGLTLPHILCRLPYGPDTQPVESFNFKEDVDGKDHHKYLWGNAAYAMGTRLTDAFAQYGWCAAIRGREGGGTVSGLPCHTFKTDTGATAIKCPTEIAITDRREKELADSGFIPLSHYKNTDHAVFFAVQSAQKPVKYDKPAATANARLSTQMQYILATSRFAHYLKVICRDKIGAFMTRQNCEDYLNRWISNYVLLDDNAGQELKAKFPLREARIQVEDDPSAPGCYKAVAHLRPHFQLDELSISLRLVATLPEPKGK